MPRISLSLFVLSSTTFASILFFQLGGKTLPAEMATLCLYAPASLFATMFGINVLPKKLISNHENYCRSYLGLQDKIKTNQVKVYIQPYHTIAPLAVGLFLSFIIPVTMPELTVEKIIIQIFFFQALFVLACVDCKYFMLPEEITLPLIILGLGLAVSGLSNVSLEEAVMGAIFPASTLATAFTVMKLVTKRELMGIGDYYMISILGSWFGMNKLPSIFIMTTVISIFYAVVLKTRKIPLGLPLALSAYMTTFFPAINF